MAFPNVTAPPPAADPLGAAIQHYTGGGGAPTANPLDAAIQQHAEGPAQPLQVQNVPQAAPTPRGSIPIAPKDLTNHPLLTTVEDGLKMDYRAAKNLRLAEAEARAQGVQIGIEGPLGAFRTREQQASPNIQSQPVHAPPGGSWHETGAAVDLAGDFDKFDPIARKYGFERSVPGDSAHYTFQPLVTGKERVWTDAQVNKFMQAKEQAGSPQDSLVQQARSLGYDPSAISVFARQIQQESGFNPKAVSPAGAIGAPQFMPGTLAPYLAKHGYTASDYTDNPATQMQLYLDHMGDLLKKNGGNLATTLSDYNAGGGATDAFKAGHPVYNATASYVGHILGVPPQKAAQWIATGGGPNINLPNPITRQVAARNNLAETMKSYLNLINPVAAGKSVSDTVGQGLDAATSQNPGMTPAGVVLKDLQEFGKTVGYGTIAALAGMQEVVTKYASGVGGPLGPLGLYSGLGAKLMGSLADQLKPDEEWAKPFNAQHNLERNGQTGTEWAWNAAKDAAHGKFSTLTDPRALQANAESILMNESGPMIGAGVGLHYLGAAMGPGVVAKFGAPGALLDHVLLNSGPLARVSNLLGRSFFRDLSATQGLAISQMGAMGMGQALHEGKTLQEAAIEGACQAAAGAVLGTLIHLGRPVFTKMAGAGGATPPAAPPVEGGGPQLPQTQDAPQQSQPAAGEPQPQAPEPPQQHPQDSQQVVTDNASLLKEPLEAAHKELNDPANPFKLAVKPSIEAIFGALDAPVDPARPGSGGSATRAAYENMQRFARLQAEATNLNVQQDQARQFMMRGVNLNGVVQQVQQWMEPTAKEIDLQQNVIQKLQEWQKAWAAPAENGALANNPNFQQAVKLVKMAPTTDPLQPIPEMKNKTLQQLIDEAFKHLSPADGAQVGPFVEHVNQLDAANANLVQLKQRLPDALRAQLQNDLIVIKAVGDHANQWGQNLAAKNFDIDQDAILRINPDGALPSTQAQLDAIVESYKGAVKQQVADNLGPLSTAPNILYQRSTMTLRSLLDAISDVGDPAARMAHIVDDLEGQLLNLRAQAPVKPEPPKSGYKLSVKDGRYVSGEYTQESLAYKEDLKAWEAQKATHEVGVRALESHISQISDGLEGFQNQLRQADSIPEGVKRQFQSAEEQELRQKLSDAGVKGGLEQLDRLYNAPKVDANKALKEFWQANPQLREQANTRRITTKDLSLPVRNEFDYAKEEGLRFIKVRVPMEWVAEPNLDTFDPKVEHLRQNEVADPDEIGKGLVRRPVLLSKSSGGKLSILDGNARVQKSIDQGRSEIQSTIREDRWAEFLKEKLGDAHDVIAGARGDLPTPSDKDLWKMLSALGSPGKYGADYAVEPVSRMVPTEAKPEIAGGGRNTVETFNSERRETPFNIRNNPAQNLKKVRVPGSPATPDQPDPRVAPGLPADDRDLIGGWLSSPIADTPGKPQGPSSTGYRVTETPHPGWTYFLRSNGETPAPGEIPTTSGQLAEDAGTRQEIDFNTRIGANQVSPSGIHNVGILQRAEEHIAGLSHDEMQAAVDAQWVKMVAAFDDSLVPSKPALQQILRMDPLFSGEGAPPPSASWTTKLPTALQDLMVQRRELNVALRNWLECRRPQMVDEAVGRATNCFMDWTHAHTADTAIKDAVASAFGDHLDAALDKLGMKREGGRLPPVFGEETVDAIQSLSSDPSQMQAYLRRYPAMRDVMAAHFGIMQVAELNKVSSPDLENMFHTIAFPQRFPEVNLRMREMHKYDPGTAQIMTGLYSEQSRQIPTLRIARELYDKAQSKVLSAPNWSKFKSMEGQPAAEKINRFYQMSGAERLRLFGEGTKPSDINRMLLHLGLDNPITDPAELSRIHIGAMLHAETNRVLLSHLASVPAPGMDGLRAQTGKPYSLLEHYPTEGGEPASMPSLRSTAEKYIINEAQSRQQSDHPIGTYLSKPTRLTELGWGPNDSVKIGGQNFPARELWLHSDVAAKFNDYFRGADPKGLWSGINELTRTSSLALGGPVHLMRIMAAHNAAEAGYAMQSMWKGLKSADVGQTLTGMRNLFCSPSAGLRNAIVGNNLSTNFQGKVDMALHGLNQRILDQTIAGAANEVQQVYRQSGLTAFSADSPQGPGVLASMQAGQAGDALAQVGTQGQALLSDISQHRSFGDAWNEARAANTLGGTVKGFAAAGLSAFRNWEQISAFQAIEHAGIGAYYSWLPRMWEDVGQKLVDQGLPVDTALRECKLATTNMVNTLNGVPQPYKTPVGVQNALYNQAWGQLVLSPNYLRTKVENYTAALTGNLMNGGAYSPAMQSYTVRQFRAQWAAFTAFALVANKLWHKATDSPDDPAHPSFMRRVGDKMYWGANAGPYGTLYNELGKGNPSIIAATLNMAHSQMQGAAAAIPEILANKDWQGNPIYNDEQGQGPGDIARASWDTLKYLGMRTANFQPVTDLFSRTKTPGEKAAGFLGTHQDSNLPQWVKDNAESRKVMEYPKHRILRSIHDDLNVATEKMADGSFKWGDDDRQQAKLRMNAAALDVGTPLTKPEMAAHKGQAQYTWDAGQLEKAIVKRQIFWDGVANLKNLEKDEQVEALRKLREQDDTQL